MCKVKYNTIDTVFFCIYFIKTIYTNCYMSEKKSSNKSFGITFFIFFFIILLYKYLFHDILNIFFLVISVVFLILGLLNSKILTPLNFLWMMFGNFLGKTIGPIVMALIYFVGVLLTKFIVLFLNKDILKLNISNKKKSYWECNDQKNNKTMDNQF